MVVLAVRAAVAGREMEKMGTRAISVEVANAKSMTFRGSDLVAHQVSLLLMVVVQENQLVSELFQ